MQACPRVGRNLCLGPCPEGRGRHHTVGSSRIAAGLRGRSPALGMSHISDPRATSSSKQVQAAWIPALRDGIPGDALRALDAAVENQAAGAAAQARLLVLRPAVAALWEAQQQLAAGALEQACQACASARQLALVQGGAPSPPELFACAACLEAQAWLHLGQDACRAQEILTTALELLPGHSCALWLQAQALHARGLHDSAYCALRRLQTASPGWQGLQDFMREVAAACLQQASGDSSGSEDDVEQLHGGMWSSGASPHQARHYQAPPAASLELKLQECCRVLGIPTAGNLKLAAAEVRKAYLQAAARLHPDSAMQRAASSAESTRAAAEAFVRVQQAYEFLLAHCTR